MLLSCLILHEKLPNRCVRKYLSSLKAHQNLNIFLGKKLPQRPYTFLCIARRAFVSSEKDNRCHFDVSVTQIICVTGGGITCSIELPCEAADKWTFLLLKMQNLIEDVFLSIFLTWNVCSCEICELPRSGMHWNTCLLITAEKLQNCLLESSQWRGKNIIPCCNC